MFGTETNTLDRYFSFRYFCSLFLEIFCSVTFFWLCIKLSLLTVLHWYLCWKTFHISSVFFSQIAYIQSRVMPNSYHCARSHRLILTEIVCIFIADVDVTQLSVFIKTFNFLNSSANFTSIEPLIFGFFRARKNVRQMNSRLPM